MRALEIREKYLEYFLNQGFVKLPEHPVINDDPTTSYFNGSALTPNLAYFIGTKERLSDSMFTQQRVFWTRNADCIGHNPVWTIFQVMMSFYQFNQPEVKDALQHIQLVLTEVFQLNKHDLFVLIENDPQIASSVVASGFLSENIVKWNNMTKFKAGEQLKGTYCRVVIRHKHGMLPIWDLIYMKSSEKINVLNFDSCLLLERITFVLQQKTTWFETESFLPLIHALEEKEGSSISKNQLIFQIAVIIRSIVAAMSDGARITNKGQGYVIKKLIRTLLTIMTTAEIQLPVERLVRPSLSCLQNIGYDFTFSQSLIEDSLAKEADAFHTFRKQSERFINNEIKKWHTGKRSAFTMDDLNKWKDARGILPEHAMDFLKRNGCQLQGSLEEKEDSRVFLSDGYPFDTKQQISNPILWLKSVEPSR